MDTAPNSEKELVRMLKAGSIEAFDALYHLYERRLFAFSFRLFGSAEDAAEVVQEVFYKIWKHRASLDAEKSFKSFIFTVARNHIYNQISKRVSEAAYKHYYEGVAPLHASSTEDAFNLQELQAVLDQHMSEMPEKRRMVLQLSRFEGLSNHEISQKMNISLSTVENHINKALNTLRHHLGLQRTLLITSILMLLF